MPAYVGKPLFIYLFIWYILPLNVNRVCKRKPVPLGYPDAWIFMLMKLKCHART